MYKYNIYINNIYVCVLYAFVVFFCAIHQNYKDFLYMFSIKMFLTKYQLLKFLIRPNFLLFSPIDDVITFTIQFCHLLQHWLTKVERGESIILRIMLISMLIPDIYNIYYIYIYILYIYIYIYNHKTLISHHGCSYYYSTITTIYIIVI